MARVYKNFLDAVNHAPLSVKGEINVAEMVIQAGRTGRDPLELLLAKVKVELDLNGMFDVNLSDIQVRCLEQYRDSIEATLRSVLGRRTPVRTEFEGVVSCLPSRAIQIQTLCHPGDLNCGVHVRLYALCADGSIWVQYDSCGSSNVPSDLKWYLVNGGVS